MERRRNNLELEAQALELLSRFDTEAVSLFDRLADVLEQLGDLSGAARAAATASCLEPFNEQLKERATKLNTASLE